MNIKNLSTLLAAATLLASLSPLLVAQERPRRNAWTSPEVGADRKITFRIQAAKADTVKFFSDDMPQAARGLEMKKSDQGLWGVEVGPVDPGAYRYTFNIDGVSIIDPKNTATSESNSNTWSLVYVAGSDTSDLKDVPHGAVANVTYFSKSLQRFRRMHIYTPPGYESGEGKFPVFYLLHGASDSDDAWSTVGRAGFILDNLIAAGKAKPMIVVMPNGHTGTFRFGPGEGSFDRQVDEFVKDFEDDIKPYVEQTYRVIGDRAHRAIAGLSMGGAQTMNIAIRNLNEYGYVGVYSSGVFGIDRPGRTDWEEKHATTLDDAKQRDGLKLVWFATGKEDFLLKTSQATVDVLKKHGFDVTYQETGGGHTWINWRQYLSEFAPLLF